MAVHSLLLFIWRRCHQKKRDDAPLKAGVIVTTDTITITHDILVEEAWISEVKDIRTAGLTVKFVP